eukprot:SAG31_NODE_15950_length_730_cov_0.817750_1_plen_159_part_01
MTLSVDGSWYWRPGQPIKTLAYLTSLHDASVGHNANLLLNFSPTYSGQLPAEGVAMYKRFGDWRRACYGESNKINSTGSLSRSGLQPQVGVTLALETPLELQVSAGLGGWGTRGHHGGPNKGSTHRELYGGRPKSCSQSLFWDQEKQLGTDRCGAVDWA